MSLTLRWLTTLSATIYCVEQLYSLMTSCEYGAGRSAPVARLRKDTSADFVHRCSLFDEERRRRRRPWEAAQPDLLAAEEFIDRVGFAIAWQCILVECNDATGANEREEVAQAGERSFVIIEVEVEQRDPRAQLTARV